MAAPSAPYPFAAAPDIVRAHQRDAFFTAHVAAGLADVHRRLCGARAAHARGPERRALAALLYLALTTLPGNRTLGEEYCDLVQVRAPDARLPALGSRAAYVAAAAVLPYLAARAAPALRARLRAALDRRIAELRRRRRCNKAAAAELRVCEYVARHLSALTSPAPVQAVSLALFYFSGTYYELPKRLLSLRYVFTRNVPDTPDRAGYDVLGVLLVIQLAAQAYLHLRSTLSSSTAAAAAAAAALPQQHRERAALESATADGPLSNSSPYLANGDVLLANLGGRAPPTSTVDLAATTNTPVTGRPRFDLADDKVMAYINGRQQRKCTLCLEALKDPAATQCGHVFCWECIGDWVREKPECPLCRREAMVQHILPLRAM